MNVVDFDKQTYKELEWVWKLKHPSVEERRVLEFCIREYLGCVTKIVNLRELLYFVRDIKWAEYKNMSADYIINGIKDKSVKFVHLVILKKFNDNPKDARTFIKRQYAVLHDRFKRAKAYIDRWRNKRFSYDVVFKDNDYIKEYPVVKKIVRHLKDPTYSDLTAIEFESFLGGTVPLVLYRRNPEYLSDRAKEILDREVVQKRVRQFNKLVFTDWLKPEADQCYIIQTYMRRVPNATYFIDPMKQLTRDELFQVFNSLFEILKVEHLEWIKIFS